jgi:ribosomal protein S18 acetylase RimI-like enzyme
MKPFPTGFTKLQQIDAAELATQGYEVWAGLSPEYVAQIIHIAQEPSIREYCPNDAAFRFTDSPAAGRWLAKGRGAFLLIKQGDNTTMLAGYGWSGPETNEQVSSGETTFALRISERCQGQGLATPFAAVIIAASVDLYGARNFWLETWQSNAAAVHVYHKLGFTDVDATPSQRPTADGTLVSDTRLYMTLANS